MIILVKSKNKLFLILLCILTIKNRGLEKLDKGHVSHSPILTLRAKLKSILEKNSPIGIGFNLNGMECPSL